MTRPIDADRFRLSDADHQRIFVRHIVPDLFTGTKSSSSPAAVVFGGQPGAGKSSAVLAAADDLRRRGGAVVINGDELRAYHDHYAKLMCMDDRTAAFYTDRDTGRWIEKAIDHARDHRLNVVVEGTMRDANKVAATLSNFRTAGYETDARALAVNHRLSELAITQRYEQQRAIRGSGRMTTDAAHQAGFEGVPITLARIESERLADRVSVLRRGGEVVYQNELRGGEWVRPPDAAGTLERERSRPLNAAELRQVVADYSKVANLMMKRQAPALERAAVDAKLRQGIGELNQHRGRNQGRER